MRAWGFISVEELTKDSDWDLWLLAQQSQQSSQSSLVSDTGDDARMGSVIFILFMMTNIIIFIYGNRADL